MFKIICLILFWESCYINLVVGSRTNFYIQKFELCNGTQGLIKFYGNVTTEGNKQFLSYNMTTPVPWDENLGFSWLIQTKGFGNNYVHLFNIREKYMCKAVNTYLGEFWYDILRGAQIPAGVCPILAGRYHAHHVLLDFTKISLQTFPFGKLRFYFQAINNRNPAQKMWCMLIEVENPTTE